MRRAHSVNTHPVTPQWSPSREAAKTRRKDTVKPITALVRCRLRVFARHQQPRLTPADSRPRLAHRTPKTENQPCAFPFASSRLRVTPLACKVPSRCRTDLGLESPSYRQCHPRTICNAAATRRTVARSRTAASYEASRGHADPEMPATRPHPCSPPPAASSQSPCESGPPRHTAACD